MKHEEETRRIGVGVFSPRQLWTSVPDALRKLNPKHQLANPVMFVVWVGSLLTTVFAITDPSVFTILIAVWLWFTVLFANLAEAVAEGRGKAQAETLRKSKKETVARRLTEDGSEEAVPGVDLRIGDLVVVEAGQVIPGDGDVVEGIATVDESAITGESAPVIRESGGDRCAVTGGTTVLSDRIVVKITTKPGESFVDRMIALVEGASRQKTPNEIALTILLSTLTIICLLAMVALQPMVAASEDEKLAEFVEFTAQTRMSGINVGDREVRKGATASVRQWVRERGGEVPDETERVVDEISGQGGTPLVVAEVDSGKAFVRGVIRLSDMVKPGMKARFEELRAMGIKTVMIIGDNPLTARDRRGRRRRRLSRRGQARGQNGPDLQGAGGQAAGRDDR